MPHLPTDWGPLCLLVFLLGMRHGVDADHLAAINGFVRIAQQRAARRHARDSRYSGALFCLGHGAVVVSVAMLAALLGARWAPPGWLQARGGWMSVVLLLALGSANLHAVLRAAPRGAVALVGCRSRLLLRLAPGASPAGIAAVGALFALSFDTLSLAALFALAAVPFGGLAAAIALALVFVLGMLVTDGLNGWWAARLIAHAAHAASANGAGRAAALASRATALAVAGASLVVAALGIARLLSPAVDGWSDGKGLAVAGGVVGALALGVVVGSLLARRNTADGRSAPCASSAASGQADAA